MSFRMYNTKEASYHSGDAFFYDSIADKIR